MTTAASSSKGLALIYDAPGAPESVLSLRDLPARDPGPDEVKVQFMLAPINPSDINTLEGKYPLKPTLPGVPGNEGLGRVTALGSQVTGLDVDDWIVPLDPTMGTWRQEATFPAASLYRVPKDIPAEAAACLYINPPSALAMLEQFVPLKPGDVVIQNGANSAVGKLVIQMAKAMGVKTINIIRDRPNWDEAVEELRQLGADVVTTDARAREDMKASGLPPGALGLNCVGGASAVTVAKLLQDGGTVVTYGGMSMQPVSVPTSLLIFKDLTFKGFWLSGRFDQQQGRQGRSRLLDQIVAMYQEGKLTAGPTQKFPLAKFQEALEYYQQERRPAKVLLEM